MPNLIAYLVLLSWPLVMVFLFKKLSPAQALTWSFLGAFMLIPPEVYIDLPLIPTLNKYTLPSLAALVLCMAMLDQKIRFFPNSRLVTILMVGFVLAPFLTVINNREPVIWGFMYLPGLSAHDAMSEVLRHAITIIPFILGFNVFNSPIARRELLSAFMIGGLIYSVPILLEVRLSPQINAWVYGYFPELFIQQIRFGGYRPMVFMGHGLLVAYFIVISVLSTAILLRENSSGNKGKYLAILAYLLLILFLCKSVGSIVYAVLFLPIILFLGTRFQRMAILLCSVFVLTYPVLRAADAIPVDRMLDYAAMIQAERAHSLGFRFENEKMLLDRAQEKPVSGWGYWNRNRVFDPESGRDLTVPDGYWIIVLGVLGWFGYVTVFGLLTYPLIVLQKLPKSKTASANERVALGIAIALTVNLVDLIPNAPITYFTWMFAGLLLAYVLQTSSSDVEGSEETDRPPEIIPIRRKRHARNDGSQSSSAPPKFQRKKRSGRNVKTR